MPAAPARYAEIIPPVWPHGCAACEHCAAANTRNSAPRRMGIFEEVTRFGCFRRCDWCLFRRAYSRLTLCRFSAPSGPKCYESTTSPSHLTDAAICRGRAVAPPEAGGAFAAELEYAAPTLVKFSPLRGSRTNFLQ